MDNDDLGMYDTDDYERNAPDQKVDRVGLIPRGVMTTIDVNGTKVDVPSVDYVRETQRLLLELSNRVKTLGREMQSMDFEMKKQARLISNLRSQLEGRMNGG